VLIPYHATNETVLKILEHIDILILPGGPNDVLDQSQKNPSAYQKRVDLILDYVIQ
jgi:gamma-glutamyl-gamma-aminobutyrate hydrolase PuuD